MGYFVEQISENWEIQIFYTKKSIYAFRKAKKNKNPSIRTQVISISQLKSVRRT